MWTDPIVAELHCIREPHAREFGYDLRRIFQNLRKEQESNGRRGRTTAGRTVRQRLN